MLRVALLLLTVAVGIAAGVAATALLLRGQPVFGALRGGPWTAWPEAGMPDADPYARALFARIGRLPLPSGVGLRLLAKFDDAGRPLEGRCDYALAGPFPPARYWTLTVLDSTGPSPAPSRTGFTSAEVLRDGDGTVAVALARQARPGNWLPLPGEGRFMLMLSLYDTPLGTSPTSASASLPTVPGLTRLDCR